MASVTVRVDRDTVKNVTNWKPDPYGIHELRFFSADGKPTLLVMDDGKTSYDRPPAVEPSIISNSSPTPDPQGLAPKPPVEDAPTSDGPEPPPLSLPPAPRAALAGTQAPQKVGPSEHTVALDASARMSEKSDLKPAGPINEMVTSHSTSDDVRETEPMGRPLKIMYGIVVGLLAVSALGLLIVHLPHSTKRSPHRAAAGPSTTVSTRSTTTATTLPTAPKPSAEAAASALVSSWSTGNRLAALSVATESAATTLFAAPYASGMAIDRGCSTSFTPIVCTFGPPGGASPNDPIYEILVSQSPGGWYVSSVKIEN